MHPRIFNFSFFKTKLLFSFSFLFLLIGIFLTANETQAANGSFGGGDGTSVSTPYQVEDCLDLQAIGSYLSSYFILNNDIDCAVTSTWNSGAGFVPIGNFSTKFSGNFNGNYHNISDLNIDRSSTDYVGLFGAINSAAIIKNVGLVDIDITGRNYVGALIGQSYGIASSSYSTGLISGNDYVGGLVGFNLNSSSAIYNSYSRVHVTSAGAAGGLIGINYDGTITNSYATGIVTGGSLVGGFSGDNANTVGSISNSFSTGKVAATSEYGGFTGRTYVNITNSYWHNHGSNSGSCVGTYIGGIISCTGVADGNHPDYFFLSSNAPLTSWDFSNVWIINSSANDNYPYLKNFSAPTSGSTTTEDFETGDLTNLEWHTSGNQNWTVITGGDVYAGTYSAKAGAITNSQSTSLYFTATTSSYGVISFKRKVSSESGFDFLKFYIDGGEQENWSGEVAWGTEFYYVSAGTHTFTWTYSKDGSDSAGSDTAWIDEVNFTYENTGDTSPPTVSYLNPTDNATGVASTSSFEIAFNEDIATGTGYIYLYKTSDDSLVEAMNVASSTVTASGTSALIINPTTNLESNTEYYIIIDATAIDDTANNSYAGITASTTWSFTSADIENPAVLYLNPTDNATGVASTTSFEIAFNEDIATGTGYIYLFKTSDDSLVEAMNVANSNITASGTSALIINPAADLESNTEYYIIIDATAIDDTANNSYTGITASTTWSFTSADIEDPGVSTLSPADNADSIAIGANLIITFNEVVVVGSGNISIYKASDDSLIESVSVTSDQVTGSTSTTITINPSSDFDYSTEYYVLVASTAFDDTSGNDYAGITSSTTWSFTTLAPTCPSVANAATYNSYPGCGVATCNSGYTLSGGVCVASGGSSSLPSAPAIGDGIVDASIPMNEFKDIGEVSSKGINSMMYINSEALFSVKVSYTKKKEIHKIRIVDLDISKNIVKLIIESEPKELTLSLTDKKKVDLDNDGIYDMEITFADLLINRVELTIKELIEENEVEKPLDPQNKINIFEIKNDNLYFRLKGKIILRVEAKGEAYYINPDDNKMHYLGRPADAFQVMRELGLGISEKDFNSFNAYAPKRLAGKILLRVEARGEAYYVNPTDLKMHYLGRPADAFQIMRNLGLGVSEGNFGKIGQGD